MTGSAIQPCNATNLDCFVAFAPRNDAILINPGLMVRDVASRLLTMRVKSLAPTSSWGASRQRCVSKDEATTQNTPLPFPRSQCLRVTAKHRPSEVRRSGDSPPSRPRLRLVQIGRETVLRRRNGIEQHQRADLSAMTDAVSDHMHEHLLARHAAGGAVGEREIDLFRQMIAIQRRYIIDVLLIARSDIRG